MRIVGISIYKFSGTKNDTTVKINPTEKIPVKIFPEIPFKLFPKIFSISFPQPIKVVMRKIEEHIIRSIKKDCLKISNL